MRRITVNGLFGVLLAALMASCVSREKIVYFQDLGERKALIDSVQNSFKIQPNDLLSIVVYAYDLNAVRPFNLLSILGEVARPGTYNVQGERLTLPEALGLAGDMTIFGRRDNVVVVRDNNSTKEYKYIDMRESDFMNSKYYYLQQNDVIYVEPNNAQVQSSSFNRNTSIYISIASLLISVLVIAFK